MRCMRYGPEVWGRQDGSNGSSGETRVDDNFADWRSVQVKSRPWPLAQGIPLAFLFKANRTVPGLAGCHSNCPQVYQGDPGPQGTRPKRAPKIHISEIKTIFLVSAPRPRKVHPAAQHGGDKNFPFHFPIAIRNQGEIAKNFLHFSPTGAFPVCSVEKELGVGSKGREYRKEKV
ncbi:uncharacterized protein H6S33_005445 [Morchella sextelata]|uniref:uncharacterized protein n=1 Tax=Morchella sextelata TaxID=1174677 RepID=UPI001D036A15|nr:uncharacterized protein H6S33_005445 [Morchella sextelata]KAH0613559.1 hypothetical protein H6S33_005445 [Morchella sextelata]